MSATNLKIIFYTQRGREKTECNKGSAEQMRCFTGWEPDEKNTNICGSTEAASIVLPDCYMLRNLSNTFTVVLKRVKFINLF